MAQLVQCLPLKQEASCLFPTMTIKTRCGGNTPVISALHRCKLEDQKFWVFHKFYLGSSRPSCATQYFLSQKDTQSMQRKRLSVEVGYKSVVRDKTMEDGGTGKLSLLEIMTSLKLKGKGTVSSVSQLQEEIWTITHRSFIIE